MQSRPIAELRVPVTDILGTDCYLLAPGEYSGTDRADFLPAGILVYIGNSLLLAFAGGLIAALAPGAKVLWKRCGDWVSETLLKLLGAEPEAYKKATDAEVERTIIELKDAAKAKDVGPELINEVEHSTAEALVTQFGLTKDKAAAVAASISQAVKLAIA